MDDCAVSVVEEKKAAESNNCKANVKSLHNSPTRSVGNNSKANVKSLHSSPTRSAVGNAKSAIAPKTNKFSGKRVPAKAETKTPNNILNKANPKDISSAQPRKTDGKMSSSMTSKSSSCISPTAKSKIPARKISTLDTTKTSTESKSLNKPKALQMKSLHQKPQPVKKEPEIKQKQILHSKNSKSLEVRKTSSSISKSSFQKPNSMAPANKSNCQSARSRSSSARPILCTKNRSASNVSKRSTPCSTEEETNLGKIASAAGDGIATQNIEKDTKPVQNELLPITPQKDLEVNAVELKCKIETHMETGKLVATETDKLTPCDDEKLPSSNSDMILSLVDDFCANYKDTSPQKFKKELEEMEEKYNVLKQKYEADSVKWEKDATENAQSDIAKKAEDIKELQRKSNAQDKQINTFKSSVQSLEKEKESMQMERDKLREELKSCKDSLATTSKKLQDCEQQLKQEKRDIKSKNETIKKMDNDVKKLEKELANMTTKFELLQTEINKKAQTECDELLRQISELSYQNNCLETANAALQQHIEKLEQEVSEMEKIRKQLVASDNKLHELQTECEKRKTELASVPDCSRAVQMEFAKLRLMEAEKQREIDKLKSELTKTQLSICQLEQQIQRDQQLLDVRSGLINSLQKNEKSNRLHIEDLFAQVAEKNNTINELNCELQMKSTEFRNLSTSLSAKQVEVAKQEHIVKLLEESNERSQMLRVKHEEKIGRLEEELAHLRQTIAFHQAQPLAADNSDSHLLCSPPTNVNYSENFYYYISQRKRKRHIDINVKKYEA